HTIRLWDAGDGKCLKTLTGHSGRVLSVVFSSDGRLLASGGVDREIRLWDAVSGQCLKILPSHTNCVRSLAFSPEGPTLASRCDRHSSFICVLNRTRGDSNPRSPA